MDVERPDAPSPLPTPESFLTYPSLDDILCGEWRVLHAREVRRIEKTCLLSHSQSSIGDRLPL
jgi:hypothetical protein